MKDVDHDKLHNDWHRIQNESREQLLHLAALPKFLRPPFRAFFRAAIRFGDFIKRSNFEARFYD